MSTPQLIAVGDDGSKAAAVAIRYAADLAVALGARLEVVRAWSVRNTPMPKHSDGGVAPLDELEASVAADLAADVAKLGLPESLEVAFTAVRGQSAKVLVEASGRADLLIVGSRGQGGFAGLLMGSTAEQVVRHATTPTLVVPVAATADAG